MIRKDNIVKIIVAIILIVVAIVLLINNRIKINEDSNEVLTNTNNLNAEYTQNVENTVNPYIKKS